MAKPLSVIEIWSTPEIPISNISNTALTRKQEVSVWKDPTLPNGSPVVPLTKPIGFEIPEDVSAPVKFKVPLRIQFSAIFPADWNGPVLLKLVGSLPGKDNNTYVDVLESDAWPYTIPNDVKALPAMILSSFSLLQQINCIAPFALSGDVVWQLVRSTPDSARFPAANEAPKARLDFFWLNSIAPSGPVVAVTSMAENAVDMQAVYPVNVLSFYLPSVTTLSQFGADSVKIDWLNHIMSLFTPENLSQCFYNLVCGMSGYSVGCCGGGFDFAGWTQRRSQMVNSSDLSALVQIGVGLLLYKAARNGELCHSRWVCKYPYGKIPASNAFGWTADEGDYHTAEGANNPYFMGNGKLPILETAPIDKRLGILSRAWIEGQFKPYPNQAVTVVDTAFFVAPATEGAEVGTLSRADFGARHMVLPTKMQLSSYSGDPNNQCYVNNTFPVLPDGTLPRVGVWNLKGIPAFTVGQEPTGTVPARLDFLKLPPGLGEKLGLLIQNGKQQPSVVAGTELFNDASLLPVDVLNGWVPDAKVKAAKSDLVLGRFVSVARYSTTTGAGNEFVLEIHTHTSQQNALGDLLLQLSRFEGDIDSTDCIPDVPGGQPAANAPAKFGDYFIQHPQGYFYILGNLLVSLTLVNSPPTRESLADLRLGLSTIHTRLALQRCRSSQIRRPAMAISGVPTSVAENKAFTVTFSQAGLLAGTVDAQISQCPLLVLNGAVVTGTDSKTMEFSTLGYTEDYGSTTPMVHVLGAHAATYYPGETSFSVKLTKA